MKDSANRLTLIRKDFRLFHIFLITGAGFLLYSALGIDDDRRVINGVANMFYLHRYIGLIWGVAITVYAIYALARHRKIRVLEPLSKPFMDQVREGFSIIGRYFFGRTISQRVKSGIGRHNILASYAFVIMLVGFIFLGTGGFGMIFAAPVNGAYELFLGIHVLGAGLLTLFVLAHLFAVLNKANRPLIIAVFFHGKVTSKWAEESMPNYISEESDRQ